MVAGDTKPKAKDTARDDLLMGVRDYLERLSPKEADWAFSILAPLLGPRLRDHPEAAREAFLEAVLQVVQGPFWAAPRVDRALRKELGVMTQRAEKEMFMRSWSIFIYRDLIAAAHDLRLKEAADMRKRGKSLKRSATSTYYYNKALDDFAKKLGVDSETLDKRIERHFKAKGLKLTRRLNEADERLTHDERLTEWDHEWKTHLLAAQREGLPLAVALDRRRRPHVGG